MLYTEGVISKVTLDEIQRSGGSLTDDQMKTLSSTVSEDSSKLVTFASVLLRSEDTVTIAKDILKEYGK